MQISMKNCNITGGNVNYLEVSEGVKKNCAHTLFSLVNGNVITLLMEKELL